VQADVQLNGHAIECRVNAENADRDFMPSPGVVTEWHPPSGPEIRVDTHCYRGYSIPPFYDSMIAKLIVRAKDRAAAISSMSRALEGFKVTGMHTTIPFHRAVLAHPDFAQNRITTRWVDEKFMNRTYQTESAE